MLEAYRALRKELHNVCMAAYDRAVTDEEYEARWNAYYGNLAAAKKLMKPGHEWRMDCDNELAIIHYLRFHA